MNATAKISENGYYQLPIYTLDEKTNTYTQEEGKWTHFGTRKFVLNLQELTGKNLVEFGQYMKEIEDSIDLYDHFDAFTDLLEAAMRAYYQEQGKTIDFDTIKVGEWLYHAMENADKVMENINKALVESLPKAGKKKEGRFRPPIQNKKDTTKKK